MIEEQVGATASTARPDVQYVWGTQYVDDLVVRYRDADASGSSGSPSLEEELYSLADANFNVTAVTENDGDVIERFTYTPYGESTALDPDFTSYTGSDYNWKYRYTTRELDPLTGLQLNRERWYTNLLGRWMNRDPIGYEGGSYNLYEYVNGMPPVGLDSQGTKCTKVRNLPPPRGGATSMGGVIDFNNVSTNPSSFTGGDTDTILCVEASNTLELWKCKCCYDGRTITITNTVWAKSSRLFTIPAPRRFGKLGVSGLSIPIPLKGVLGKLGTNVGIYAFENALEKERADNACKDNFGKGKTIFSDTDITKPSCP